MNKWIIIVMIVFLIILGVFMYRRAQAKVVGAASARTIASTYSAVNSGNVGSDIGSAVSSGDVSGQTNQTNQGVVLTRSACNQVARGRCGRRPLFNTARGRAVRDCWKTVRMEVCNWDANRARNEAE